MDPSNCRVFIKISFRKAGFSLSRKYVFSPVSSKIMGIPSVSGYRKSETMILVSASCVYRNADNEKTYRLRNAVRLKIRVMDEFNYSRMESGTLSGR